MSFGLDTTKVPPETENLPMTHELLSQMDAQTAAKTVEQAGTTEFQEPGGLASQLIEMRDKNPQQYAQIMKGAFAMAQGEADPATKSVALHDLNLVDEISTIQTGIETGNLAEMQKTLGTLKKDVDGQSELAFVRRQIIQGGADAGYVAMFGVNQKGNDILDLHNPGSQFGIEIGADHATPFNWTTEQAVHKNAQDVLDRWKGAGAPNDASLRKEALADLQELRDEGSITRAVSPTFRDLGELANIAYNHGYAGKTELDAATKLAWDIEPEASVALKITNFDKNSGTANAEAEFFNGEKLSSLWHLKDQ
jgi:hypothetical protein